ncbi:hypothetical protein EA462_11575 [Natrarchaeobius halalkaliphilus]|uniref:CobQ/CobB/MinD/ParA nucleotide binding domain-containing protein n=1 Tax=Natrarchaeobius halalkaliphilus TaxID=1679091 RepID=A0A3N6P1P7_9EURY|nr:AAA family ATPase [Natrarchaeobius halalkaliphilus]RQG89015.1 hypothetical protein EA462_11575 [Natrarchaeobius halalkaliphilus]
MIAIAGSKGGCGKTTVTVGLARAFARAGDPTVAVDADRQLPNLHAVANVDRTPTLATVEADAVGAAVQPLSGTTGAGVIAAPDTTDRIDLETALDRLGNEDVRILLDCPSGCGPDVTDPLAVADAVVVVTTDTDRARRGARTTIELARRLEVPVAGAVVTKHGGETETIGSELGIPVLGTIPEHDAPLSADATERAFDHVVDRLRRESFPDRARAATDSNRLSTGICALDGALGGGFRPGSVVALTADPASQSEHLLAALTGTRGTLYLTAARSRRSVERTLESTREGAVTPTVRRVGGDARFEDATELIDKLPEGANLVIDSMNAFERGDRERYLEFLSGLVDRVTETDGLAVCHCLEGGSTPTNRSVTTHLADVVVSLRTYSAGVGTGIEHTLSIPKVRTERAAVETVALELDTDRDYEREREPSSARRR